MPKVLESDRIDRIRRNPDSSNPVLVELRELILRMLPIGVEGTRYEGFVSPRMLNKAADQAILDILRLCETLDCDDQLIPTALKFAVRHLFYHLRYQEWKSTAIEGGMPTVPSAWREKLATNPALNYVHTIFREELNENQRIALKSMLMFRVPKEEVMSFLEMDRCDYFAMIHDARLRIKHRLQRDAPGDMSAISPSP